MVKKCICEICTCGRHRCPHRPNLPVGGSDKPCMLSEYATTYHQHPIELQKSCKPDPKAFGSGMPIDDKTTHRVDYVKHPVERPYHHMPDQYKKPSGDFDLLTSYVKDYPEKHLDPAKPIKHDSSKQVHGKFEGEPTYTADYRKWNIPEHKRYGPEAAWIPPKDKFEGQSTFQRDYRRYNELPRKPLRPNDSAVMSDTPFDGTTGYRNDYVRHPLAPKFIKEREKFKPSGVPFDGVTTFKRDYRGEPGEKTKSLKPDGRAYASDAPLDDMTTFKSDYRRWPTERPFAHAQDQYKKPDGEMDLYTTHNLTYKEFPIQRHQAVKPVHRGINPGAFDGITNYNADYKPWEIDRVHPKGRPEYQPNNAPFEGLSTQKAHYIPHQLAQTHSFKPDRGAASSNAPFDDGTIYRMEYTPKHVGPCPAAILDTAATAYKFVDVDPRGHKLYQPVFTSVTDLGRNHPRMNSPKLQPLAVA